MRSAIAPHRGGAVFRQPPAGQPRQEQPRQEQPLKDTEAGLFLLVELSCVDVTPNMYLSINILILLQCKFISLNNLI